MIGFYSITLIAQLALDGFWTSFIREKLVKRTFKQTVVNLGKINFRGYNNHQDVLTDFYDHFTSINASPYSMCSFYENSAAGQMITELVAGKGN